MLLQAVAATVAILVVILYSIAAKSTKGVANHPSHVFFWGITLDVMRKVLRDHTEVSAEYMLNAHRQLGWKAFNLSFLAKHWVVLIEVDDVKCFLKDKFTSCVKGPGFQAAFSELLGKGIFNVNGSEWKEQRIVAAHLFNRRQLRDRMSTVFAMHAQGIVNVLRKKAADGPVDMQKIFYNFTFDSINSVAFNRLVDSQGGNPQDCAFQVAFDRCAAKVMTRFLIQWWPINKMLQTEDERVITECTKTINEYVYNVVDEYLDADGKVREDTLVNDQTMTGLFLQYYQDEGKSYTKGFIRDMILNFVIAGRDTTGAALTSCIEFMVKPEYEHFQKKLAAEAAGCFGDHPSDPLTYDDMVDKSAMAEAVFLEALRLHPSVPANEKMCTADFVLPSGIHVKKGDTLGWCVLAINRNPHYWGQDAEEFKPERWLEDGRITNKYDDFMYPTFNAGPRLCLGKNMAILEGKTALLTLFQHFTFSAVDGFVPKLLSSVTWQLENGMHVHVHPRA
ncbi:Cytochrome P450 704C1 [Diplonema papillatum]|nr:Cytochrome P450 704C1 [Diplonema papillatum]